MKANKTQSAEEKSKSLKALVMFFIVLGVVEILSGITNFFFGAVSSNLSSIRLTDSVFSIILGILVLICSRALARGKVLVIWLFGCSVLFATIYGIAMGRGLNFVIMAVGGLFIWHLFTLKKQGEIS